MFWSAVSFVDTVKTTLKFVYESGFTPSGENYQKVVSILKDRYGDPAKLTSQYYSKLEKMARAQRRRYDDSNKSPESS